MGKLTNYLIIMSGILLLFHFGGLMGTASDTCNSANPNNALLCLLLSPEDLPNTEFAINKVVFALQGIGLGIIIIGAAVTGNLELALVAPVAIFMFNLLWSFLDVFNKLREINPVFAVLIFAPILIMFVVTILDWWRGRDT